MTAEHDELESLVAGYVLGASDPEETESLRTHIQGCASCRELAQRLTRSVASLPLAAEEARPPARLRERILAAAATGQQPGFAILAPPRQRKILPLPLPKTARVRRQRRIRVSGYGAAVAVLAMGLLALGAWNISLYMSVNQLSQGPARYTFQGGGPMKGSSISVTNYSRDEVTILDFRGMPALAPGSVYQLWLIPAKGNPVSAGIFTIDPSGSRQLVLTRNLTGVHVIAVTQEKGSEGAPQPTQAPTLAGVIA